MHFWGCLDGMCEMSTIFLNNVWLSKEVTIGNKELKELLPAWAYAANGCFLWLSFLVFRIVLFPAWLYMWYSDVRTSPEATWVPITRGLLKALGLTGDQKSKDI